MTHRRRLLATLAAGALLAVSLPVAAEGPAAGTSVTTPAMTVWKDPNCGCCGAWVEHMRAAGYRVEVRDTGALDAVKRMYGVPPRLHSCHTALVDGYLVEGHVPAEDVGRLLAERPKARGLAVPGMPHGSPGMETGHKDPYDVVLFGADGGDKVFASR